MRLAGTVIPVFHLPMAMLYYVLFSVKNGWFSQVGITEVRKMRVRRTFTSHMLLGAPPEPAQNPAEATNKLSSNTNILAGSLKATRATAGKYFKHI